VALQVQINWPFKLKLAKLDNVFTASYVYCIYMYMHKLNNYIMYIIKLASVCTHTGACAWAACTTVHVHVLKYYM